MNLRQWADAIADCMIEWEHTSVFEDKQYREWDKARFTILTHVCGAKVHLQAEPERCIYRDRPDLDADVLDRDRLIFSSSWPRSEATGVAMPNHHQDKTNYRATVSADRTPQSVANGIQARFIKPYLAKWYDRQRYVDATIESHAKAVQFVNELSALIGTDTYPDNWFDHRESASVAFLEISKFGGIHLTRRYTDKITPEFARKLLLLWSGQADIVMLDPVPMPLFADIEELVP